MRNKVIFLLASILLIGVLAGCGSGKDSDTLVVYSPNSDGIINAVIPAFEKETGITVELISAGTGELFKRLQAEKDDPYADVMFGGGASNFFINPDLFMDYVSPNAEHIIEGRDFADHDYMTSTVSDGSVLLVNTNLIGDIKIEGYADLLNPELKGKIAAADPASSSSAFTQLTNMLLAMGGYDSDEAWDYVAELIKNLDGKVGSSSGAVHKSVADGEYVVALTYEDPAADYVRSGAPVEIVYPVEGTVFLDAPAAIIKNANNVENAKKFIDFVISKEAQDALGTESTNRPVRADAELGDHMTPMEDIYTITEDEDYVNEHKDALIQRYTELFAELQE